MFKNIVFTNPKKQQTFSNCKNTKEFRERKKERIYLVLLLLLLYVFINLFIIVVNILLLLLPVNNFFLCLHSLQ